MSTRDLSNQAPHSSPGPPQRFHGVQPIRGLEDVPRSSIYEGRFGRMFRNLLPLGINRSSPSSFQSRPIVSATA
jgi:hypothetical protein